MRKKIQEFRATDGAGVEYTICVWQEYIDMSCIGSPAETPGLKHMETADGEPVQRIKQGEYRLVTTGAVLRASGVDAT